VRSRTADAGIARDRSYRRDRTRAVGQSRLPVLVARQAIIMLVAILAANHALLRGEQLLKEIGGGNTGRVAPA